MTETIETILVHFAKPAKNEPNYNNWDSHFKKAITEIPFNEAVFTEDFENFTKINKDNKKEEVKLTDERYKFVAKIAIFAHGSSFSLDERTEKKDNDSKLASVDILNLRKFLKKFTNLCFLFFFSCTVGRPRFTLLPILAAFFPLVQFVAVGIELTRTDLLPLISLVKYSKKGEKAKRAIFSLKQEERKAFLDLEKDIYFFNEEPMIRKEETREYIFAKLGDDIQVDLPRYCLDHPYFPYYTLAHLFQKIEEKKEQNNKKSSNKNNNSKDEVIEGEKEEVDYQKVQKDLTQLAFATMCTTNNFSYHSLFRLSAYLNYLFDSQKFTELDHILTKICDQYRVSEIMNLLKWFIEIFESTVIKDQVKDSIKNKIENIMKKETLTFKENNQFILPNLQDAKSLYSLLLLKCVLVFGFDPALSISSDQQKHYFQVHFFKGQVSGVAGFIKQIHQIHQKKDEIKVNQDTSEKIDTSKPAQFTYDESLVLLNFFSPCFFEVAKQTKVTDLDFLLPETAIKFDGLDFFDQKILSICLYVLKEKSLKEQFYKDLKKNISAKLGSKPSKEETESFKNNNSEKIVIVNSSFSSNVEPIENWSSEEVINWLKELDLAHKDFSLVEKTEIDGKVLLKMKTEHWVGVEFVMKDIFKIEEGLKQQKEKERKEKVKQKKKK